MLMMIANVLYVMAECEGVSADDEYESAVY